MALDNSERMERAMEAGMLHGIDAYNEALGFSTEPPEPPSQEQQYHRCPKCGDWYEDCECYAEV